ncbi:MAG: hypothetical protein ACLR43_12280 [Faecalibacillus faecis]
MVRLELEKKAIGVYLTQHPLAYMKQKINQPILAVANLNEYVSKNVRVLLSLLRVKVIVDKKEMKCVLLKDLMKQEMLRESFFLQRIKDIRHY